MIDDRRMVRLKNGWEDEKKWVTGNGRKNNRSIDG
jgi:hypothetical protein